MPGNAKAAAMIPMIFAPHRNLSSNQSRTDRRLSNDISTPNRKSTTVSSSKGCINAFWCI
jgi:hypothetical protein